MSPMKRVTMACVLRPRCDPSPIARSKAANVTTAPITAAAIARDRKTIGRMDRRQRHHGGDRPRPRCEHDERGKGAACIRIVIRGRCLTDRMTAAQHIESHIRNDHPADDPEHVQ
jgi:hypothetical protein